MAQDVASMVQQLRSQGLQDHQIVAEMTKRGFSPEEADRALESPTFSMPQSLPADAAAGNIYERMEEIAEGLIDAKWDDLIAEVKKIIEWKQKLEEKQLKAEMELTKLKEDFTTLHQAVLGRLGDYDQRMEEVGTELKAVGKVFKDVVPTFVENVKELSGITSELKKK